MSELTKISLFAIPVVLGISLLLLARWASRRNKQLDTKKSPFLYDDFVSEARQGNIGLAFKKYFLGTLDRSFEKAGRVMAICVIVGTLFALVAMAVAVIYVRLG